jgi:hypothetical protein
MSALIRHVALVSESQRVRMNDLLVMSAALQKQASRDLAPIWEISATVDAFAKLDDVADGYWPMIIKDNIGYDAAGIHMDKDGQPFALISSGDNLDDCSLTASHEMCEMLVDPSGRRRAIRPSPDRGGSAFWSKCAIRRKPRISLTASTAFRSRTSTRRIISIRSHHRA